MKIELKKFGNILMSRPEGREAYLIIKESFLKTVENEKIVLDFSGVDVVAPSWLDEVLTPIKETYGKDQVTILEGNCPTLKISLEGIEY